MKKLLAVTIPLLMWAGPAVAEVPAGFRLEALIGYDRLKGDFVPANAANTVNSGSEGAGGVFYGGSLGFDVPMGGAVSFGLDGELTLATTDVRTSAVRATRDELRVSRDLYVGGRVTGMLSDSINIYAKAGFTNLRLRFRDDDTDTAPPQLAGNLNGVRGAFGLQFGDEDRSYYGFEARYSDYEGDLTRQQGLVFVGYRF